MTFRLIGMQEVGEAIGMEGRVGKEKDQAKAPVYGLFTLGQA